MLDAKKAVLVATATATIVILLGFELGAVDKSRSSSVSTLP